jgi:hypothetical protein
VNPHHTRYLFGHPGVRALTARMHRVEIARTRRAERSQRRAVRTVAGMVAWLAVTDLDRPRRRPFDSHAAWADR